MQASPRGGGLRRPGGGGEKNIVGVEVEVGVEAEDEIADEIAILKTNKIYIEKIFSDIFSGIFKRVWHDSFAVDTRRRGYSRYSALESLVASIEEV